MNDSFSGSCEGLTMVIGARAIRKDDTEEVQHGWFHFENGG
jgi:hypothetical protein